MPNPLEECCFRVGSNFIVVERTGRINNVASSKPEGFDAVQLLRIHFMPT